MDPRDGRKRVYAAKSGHPAVILRALRARPEYVALPVVFRTARTQQGDEYLALGANGVIAKPFEPKELVEQVRTHTGELLAA